MLRANISHYSCLKMRKKKSANRDVEVGEAPAKKGIFGMFGKKNKAPPAQSYNLETAQPNGMYGNGQYGKA